MRLDLIKEAVFKISGKSPEIFKINEDLYINIDKTSKKLTPWRHDRRLIAMRSLAIGDNVLRQNCSYKSTRVSHKSENIEHTLFTELDVCQWMLCDKIVSVYAQAVEDKILSLILKTERGILCSIEIALTLSSDTSPITKHEIVGKEGMISDRSINEQVPFEAVYLFEGGKKTPTTFTDMEASLYGLVPCEIALAENILAVILGYEDESAPECDEKQIKRLMTAVCKSAELGEAVKAEDTAL